ncbi:MAG TPA: cellulase family glycosylhydrolase [Gaiellaceae bacterium]
MRLPPALIAVLFAALVAAISVSSAPTATKRPKLLLVGAAEDAAKSGAAEARMALAGQAGFDTIRITSIWHPGQRTIDAEELAKLQRVADAASANGIRLIVSVYPFGANTTPQYATTRAQFAAYAASIPQLVPSIRYVIVGNEPNLNRFWMPQFTKKGLDAAASSYLGLLAQTYDAIKAAAPRTIVIGGSLAPRGMDAPRAARATHSPTRFILDLGTAYRLSGRKRPVMDWFAIHPYPEHAGIPPTFAHPRSTSISLADYDKLVGLLGKAFDGTHQRGSTLPIIYDEFGVQTKQPDDKRLLYANQDVGSAADAVDETTQGRYYRQALQLAVCQPNVVGLLFFHVSDEADLDRWQSGVYYADDTPKSDLPVVRSAALAAQAGTLVKACR